MAQPGEVPVALIQQVVSDELADVVGDLPQVSFALGREPNKGLWLMHKRIH